MVADAAQAAVEDNSKTNHNTTKTTFAVSMQGSLFNTTTMKKHFCTFIFALFAAALYAQGSDDACQFSQTLYQGTAKALGMGNALGAVGGDMTAVCINPAGLGLYRSDEFTMSLNLSDNYNASTYYGNSKSANKIRLSMPNLGFVHTRQRSNFRPLRYTQWCFGLTRTNDFNMHTYASGYNPTSSKIDEYLNQIDGYAVDELSNYFGYTAFPAWSTYLIDLDDDGYYTSPVPQGGITQSLEQEFKGRSEEWTLGYSSNYYDRLFIGVSLSLPYTKRVGSRMLAETLPDTSNIQTEFNTWHFTEDLSSIGMGFNGKIGLIWHVSRWLRMGIACHTPTFYKFTESWQTETESKIAWITNKYISPLSNYEYSFISPMKWVGSLALVMGEQGMVSLDAEYVNFGTASFHAMDYDYTSLNQEIKDYYGRTLNLRIGTEWYVGGTYLRLGAGYYGSPFGFGEPNGSIKKASAGICIPLGASTSFDIAYELSHGKRFYTLYDAGTLGIEPIEQRQFRSVALGTLKVRF